MILMTDGLDFDQSLLDYERRHTDSQLACVINTPKCAPYKTIIDMNI